MNQNFLGCDTMADGDKKQTLYDIISFWRDINIYKPKTNDEKHVINILKDKNKEDGLEFVMFNGVNGPLHARTWALAINSKNEIVDSYCTRIS